MPRLATGPRLWLDSSRGTWTISDGRKKRRTAFKEAEFAEAQLALSEYIGEKHVIPETDAPCIADILNAYLIEHVPHIASGDIVTYRIGSLSEWWGVKHPQLSDITTLNCRAYVAHREEINLQKAVEREIVKARREKREPDIEAAELDAPAGTTGARGDLEVLRAAIGHWHREKKPLKVLPSVWLPQKPDNRKQWLTRSQVAKLLWHSRRVVHNIETNPKKRPRLVRHLSRFILLGFYTGSRSGVILGTRYKMLDFDREFMNRKPHGARKSKKQAPPHKMPRRLKFWLLLWQRIDGKAGDFVVHIDGGRVKKLRRSWDTTRDKAGLPDDVTPHTLRHSRATHLMKNRNVANEDAAEFLGMTLQTFIDTYGHHDPEWQKDAADAR